MNKRTENRMKFAKKMGEMPNYKPRNTHMDVNGNVVVRGKIVCSPKGTHVRPGSFFTPKGTKPEVKEPVADLSTAEVFEHQDT